MRYVSESFGFFAPSASGSDAPIGTELPGNRNDPAVQYLYAYDKGVFRDFVGTTTRPSAVARIRAALVKLGYQGAGNAQVTASVFAVGTEIAYAAVEAVPYAQVHVAAVKTYLYVLKQLEPVFREVQAMPAPPKLHLKFPGPPVVQAPTPQQDTAPPRKFKMKFEQQGAGPSALMIAAGVLVVGGIAWAVWGRAS